MSGACSAYGGVEKYTVFERESALDEAIILKLILRNNRENVD
jgi:hypothetical protein